MSNGMMITVPLDMPEYKPSSRLLLTISMPLIFIAMQSTNISTEGPGLPVCNFYARTLIRLSDGNFPALMRAVCNRPWVMSLIVYNQFIDIIEFRDDKR
ncbi:MAG: hypothetical protein IPJ13_01530 [Saprospiraceae bacterium]|nr:hypothetical protein [Saprospiraceae bacterium]